MEEKKEFDIKEDEEENETQEFKVILTRFMPFSDFDFEQIVKKFNFRKTGKDRGQHYEHPKYQSIKHEGLPSSSYSEFVLGDNHLPVIRVIKQSSYSVVVEIDFRYAELRGNELQLHMREFVKILIEMYRQTQDFYLNRDKGFFLQESHSDE